MLATVDLIEDWIQMRATLQKQLKALEAGQARSGGEGSDGTVSVRLRKIISELTDLLKEHARDGRA